MTAHSDMFDENVAATYEGWYEQGFGRRAVKREKDLLSQQLAGFPQAHTLLDVGCGTGHFSRWFATRGMAVTGLDASPAMLADARRRDGLVTYRDGDAQALPFDDHSMDLVSLVTVLEFVTNPARALHEAMRVARYGLLIGVLNQQSLLDRWNRLRGRHPDSVLAAARRYSVPSLARLVREVAGDRSLDIEWRTAIYPWHLPLNGFRLPWGEYLAMTVRYLPA
jgi:ubiquinone/menaquinone biosynthesis C-methylase UbiE